jgi:hypothetical protein
VALSPEERLALLKARWGALLERLADWPPPVRDSRS